MQIAGSNPQTADPRALNGSGADCDVLIVGGGPVGLLLANLLGARQVRVVVVERRHEPPGESMAIGVTPPSLQILARIGLDQAFTCAGLPVVVAKVHEGRTPLGRLDFDTLPSVHRYILSIPQSKTVELLGKSLERYPLVTCLGGTEFLRLEQAGELIRVFLRQLDTGLTISLAARYVAGCDGHRSLVRQAAGIAIREKEYRPRFVMADFEDETGLGAEAHLYFTAEASVESFPLPGGRRRWIVLAPGAGLRDPFRYHVDMVRRLTGHDLSRSAHYFLSEFGATRMEVAAYHRGRVVLCGDAAHTMSSIGGQGMNTGFADAELLATALEQALAWPEAASAWFAFYDRIRRQAFRVAARRAARGMWLGTHRGRLFSGLRRWFIRRLLFAPGMRERLAPYFAMLTIPFNTLASVPLPDSGGRMPP